MNIKDLDLNLLRLFDAVWRTRSVSRAAELLDLSQPAASQGLARLRRLLGDALFVRSGGGVAPTPRAERLAQAVQSALATLEEALNESEVFDPLQARKTFRMHLSDIGESRFLPELMATLRREAPGTRLEAAPLPHDEIAAALDSGRIDIAIGYLPIVADTQRLPLLSDRYIVLLREGHPFAAQWRTYAGRQGSRDMRSASDGLEALAGLDFAAVRTHSDTLRILQLLQLEGRLRLTTAHFLSLPAIVRASDLGVLMPRSIAQGFAVHGGLEIIEPDFPLRDFTVSLHWSRRFEADPGQQWLRQRVCDLFAAR
ncbi:MAG TPA: LysR family transcriptional regulator [Ottowia sp.]|jgi:DNA-binding transcriptional LysR family regulator|nr:LysR family transcriptional regulator [Ottowia sp.]